MDALWAVTPPVSVIPQRPANLHSYSPWWASAGWEEVRERRGRREHGDGGERRSAHSSLVCNWISAAHAGRMFSSRSPCRGVLARSRFPTSAILSRLAQLMGFSLHGFLCSPSVIYMSDHVGVQVGISRDAAQIEMPAPWRPCSVLQRTTPSPDDSRHVAVAYQGTCSVPVLKPTAQSWKEIVQQVSQLQTYSTETHLASNDGQCVCCVTSYNCANDRNYNNGAISPQRPFISSPTPFCDIHNPE